MRCFHHLGNAWTKIVSGLDDAGSMNEFVQDTGIADLLLIFAVKSRLVEMRPELERLIVVDDERPRLSFPTAQGLVVVLKSECTDAGIWTVSGPGIGIRSPRPRVADLAGAALVAHESALARSAAAA